MFHHAGRCEVSQVMVRGEMLKMMMRIVDGDDVRAPAHVSSSQPLGHLFCYRPWSSLTLTEQDANCELADHQGPRGVREDRPIRGSKRFPSSRLCARAPRWGSGGGRGRGPREDTMTCT